MELELRIELRSDVYETPILTVELFQHKDHLVRLALTAPTEMHTLYQTELSRQCLESDLNRRPCGVALYYLSYR